MTTDKRAAQAAALERWADAAAAADLVKISGPDLRCLDSEAWHREAQRVLAEG